MPTTSTRSELRDLTLLCVGYGLVDPNSELLEEDELLMLLTLIETNRYTAPRVQRELSLGKKWWEDAMFDMDYDEKHFKMCFRMSRSNFWRLCDMLSVQQHFSELQEPVHLQVGVALYRFGVYGNGASMGQVAFRFDCSEGSVFKFTERVIASLICCSANFIRWPDQAERKAIGEKMAVKLFPKCIGFVDGTDVIFSQAPLENKETYWSRKKHYCMQVQVVCDPEKRIIDLFTGYPGSVHDARVYQSSPLSIRPDTYFSDQEFIIGDSAYTLTEAVVVPYRRSGAGLSSDQKKFNKHLSGERVKIEHTIGILKGRFKSLTDLRIVISKDKGHKRACDWVHACAILHNFLLEHDNWEHMEPVDHSDEPAENDYDDLVININPNKKGYYKRQALFEIYCAMNT